MAVSSRFARVRESIRSRRAVANLHTIARRSRPALPEALESRVLFSGLPTGYQEADIGTVGTAGSSSFNASTNTFTVKGAGDDVFGAADAFHYVYTTITGNGSFVARVTNVSASNSDAPSGIDLRSSLSPTAANFFTAVTPANNLVVNERTADGAVGTNVQNGPLSGPYFLKLIRTGNVVSSYISHDGVTYGLLQSATINGLGNTVDVGLAVASHDPASLATGTFDGVAATSFGAIPTFVQETDIGGVGAPGFTDFNNGNNGFAVSGAGSDLFGTADAFHYIYTTLSGDGSLTVHQTGNSAFDQSAPGGIDIRSSLSPTASNLFVAERSDTQLIVNTRPIDGGQGSNVVIQPGAIPNWLRITRTGNSITAETSSDGLTFTPVTTQSLTLGTTAFIGIAVASHDVTTLSTSSFDNFNLVGNQAPSAMLASAPNISAPQVNPYQFSVQYSAAGNTMIDASTIGGNDIAVSGPGGYTQAATLVSTGLTNGGVVTAVYSVPAPTVNGVYAVAVNANSVLDSNTIAVPAGALGTFSVAVSTDHTPPTAVLSSHPPVSSSSAPYVFEITYTDDSGVNASTIGNGNILVSGPSGFSQAATLLSTGLTNGTQVVAQYSIPAPPLQGSYSISILANQVTDTSGNPVAAGELGTFSQTGTTTGTGSISGRVVNSLNLAGIAGRTVRLNTGATAVSDSSGGFSFGNLSPGTYVVAETLPSGVVITDPANDSRQVAVVAGQTISGVTFASLPPTTAGSADLTATLSGKVPSSVISGVKGNVKIKITNSGTVAATGPATVTLLVSPNGLLSASNVVVTNVSAGTLKLKPRASKTINVKFNYPTGIASGSYRLIGVANSTASIAESNFANNTSSSTPVTIAPAFVSLSAAVTRAPVSLTKGKPGHVTVTVTNTGNTASSGAVGIVLYESPVAGFQAGNVQLTTFSRNAKIKPSGGKTNFAINFKTPITVTPGSEFLVAVLNGDTAHAVVSPTKVTFA